MPKTVKVRAKRAGQKPDFTWAREGEVFEVEETKFSRRWMEKVRPQAPRTPKKTTEEE